MPLRRLRPPPATRFGPAARSGRAGSRARRRTATARRSNRGDGTDARGRRGRWRHLAPSCQSGRGGARSAGGRACHRAPTAPPSVSPLRPARHARCANAGAAPPYPRHCRPVRARSAAPRPRPPPRRTRAPALRSAYAPAVGLAGFSARRPCARKSTVCLTADPPPAARASSERRLGAVEEGQAVRSASPHSRQVRELTIGFKDLGGSWAGSGGAASSPGGSRPPCLRAARPAPGYRGPAKRARSPAGSPAPRS